MTRAAAYVRTTSIERSEPELDPVAQRGRLERHIAESGWELTGVYEDVGPVVQQGGLPGLQAALAAAGELDRLVVVRLDRFGGAARRALKVLTRLQERGCELVCLDERFDTGAASGQAVRPLLESLSRPTAASVVPRAGGWTADLIRRHGVEVATVIDVGAAAGTPALYEAFPGAHVVLVEPLREFEQDLAALVDELGAEYVPAAAGAERGDTTLHVADDLYTTSALPQAGRGTPRGVPQTTLDALMSERNWPTPYCLKIDVEGYEPAVIAGAHELLTRASIVIAEVFVTGRFENAPTSADLVALMESHGFAVADVIDAARTGHGVHADLVFKPR